MADGGQDAASDSGQSGEDGQLASYYIERLGANPEYYPTIYLDDPPDGFDMMAIADMDAEIVGTSGDTGRGASLPELSFETLSAYDDAVCQERGGSQAAYDALPSGGDGESLLFLLSGTTYTLPRKPGQTRSSGSLWSPFPPYASAASSWPRDASTEPSFRTP